jgi:hypothetical protein
MTRFYRRWKLAEHTANNAQVEVLIEGKAQHLRPITLVPREKSRADAILGEALFILFFASRGLGFPLAEIGVNLGAVVEVIVDNRVDVNKFESGVAHQNLFRRRALVECENCCVKRHTCLADAHHAVHGRDPL